MVKSDYEHVFSFIRRLFHPIGMYGTTLFTASYTCVWMTKDMHILIVYCISMNLRYKVTTVPCERW